MCDSGPSYQAIAIVPSDTVDLIRSVRGVYVGGDGNLKLHCSDDTTSEAVTFVGVVAGTIIPVAPKRVYATGTTATNLIGLA